MGKSAAHGYFLYREGRQTYGKIYLSDKKSIVVTITPKGFAVLLPAIDLIRIHRSCLVSCISY